MFSHLHTALTALLVLAATATPPFAARGALAQTQGTITGEVVEARSGRALAQGQVFILGTGVGGLTNTAGRYLLANVPTGTVTLRVELLGYTSAERTVDVPEGGAVAVDFELSEEALALDEIVVTGTPGWHAEAGHRQRRGQDQRDPGHGGGRRASPSRSSWGPELPVSPSGACRAGSAEWVHPSGYAAYRACPSRTTR